MNKLNRFTITWRLFGRDVKERAKQKHTVKTLEKKEMIIEIFDN